MDAVLHQPSYLRSFCFRLHSFPNWAVKLEVFVVFEIIDLSITFCNKVHVDSFEEENGKTEMSSVPVRDSTNSWSQVKSLV